MVSNYSIILRLFEVQLMLVFAIITILWLIPLLTHIFRGLHSIAIGRVLGTFAANTFAACTFAECTYAANTFAAKHEIYHFTIVLYWNISKKRFN